MPRRKPETLALAVSLAGTLIVLLVFMADLVLARHRDLESGERRLQHFGITITSGERIETVLTIETKNDYEYLLFEDLKPAGFGAVEVRSGEPLYARELKESAVEGDRRGDDADYTGRTESVYRELRDRKVAVFASRMPQGVWEIRYDLRAEVPGYFHALPVVGHAMYVPEIRGNGDEVRVTFVDADDAKRVDLGGGE